MNLGADIRNVLFTPVRMREGYDMAEVDFFLDTLATAADRAEPLRPMVDQARFTPVRMREGYDMAEVDEFLERMAAASEVAVAPEPEPEPAPAEPVQPPPATPTPSVIERRPGLFARMFGRGR